MKAKLVVVGGDAKATEVNLKLPTTIGRGREVSLTLPHPLVSREHCEIRESDSRLLVRDLGSLNGTFVNNQRIEGEVELPPGELLTVGTVTFRAVYGDDPQSPVPAVAPGEAEKTVRDQAEATVATVTEEELEEAELDDEDFTEFDDLDELDELGEDEDWEALEAAGVDEGSPTGDTSIGQQPAPSPEPSVEADTQAAQESPKGDDGDDELNTFLQGLD